MRKWKSKRLAALILAAALIVEGAMPGGIVNAEAKIINNDTEFLENEISRPRNSGMPAHEDDEIESIRDFGDRSSKEIKEIVDETRPGRGTELQATYIPELSKVPHLRDQNPLGTCYAFSSIGAIEANMLKKGITASPAETDTSERALAWFTTHTVNDPLGGGEGDKNYYSSKTIKEAEARGIYDGVESGNPVYTTHVLASWTGATDEAKAPYDNSREAVTRPLYVDDSVAYDDIVHVQNWYRAYPGISNYTRFDANRNPVSVDMESFADGRDTLKELILKCGGATIAYGAADDGFVGTDGYSYYNYRDRTLNHFVTVIGWDDNYSKDNFDFDSNRPEGDGAWLCKQSWSSYDYEGDSIIDDRNMSEYKIFWISYYDTSVINSFAFEVESADNYDNNYQYDLAAQYNYLSGEVGDTIKAANVFTAKASDDELLEAVAFGTDGATNVNYTVKVYVNPEDESDPESGMLIEEATTEGATSYSGYYTVKLNNPVYLKKGDRFAAVVELVKPGRSVGFRVECITIDYNYNPDTENWFQSDVGIKEGQSYVSAGDEWIDVKNVSEEYFNGVYGNICVKAFTSNYSGEIPTETELSIDAEYNANPLKPGDTIEKSYFNIYKDISTKVGSGPWKTERFTVSENDLPKISIVPSVIPADYKGDTFKVTIKYNDDDDVKVKNLVISLDSVTEGLRVAFCDEEPVYTYSGEAIKPNVIVFYNTGTYEKVLKQKADYTVAYKNNVNAGDETSENAPKVVIKGKGDFEGEISAAFTIEPKDINDSDIVYGDAGLIVSTKEQKPTVAVKYGKKSLVKNNYGAFAPKTGAATELKDMSITYLDADKKVVPGNAIPAGAKGNYYIHIKGTNNYIGEKDIELGVGEALISKASVTMYADSTMKKPVKSYFYTGKEIVPTVKVELNNKSLVLGEDYSIQIPTGDDLTTVGTHSIIIKGLKDNAVGTKTVSFKIEGTPISKVVSKLETAKAVDYTGYVRKPSARLLLKNNSISFDINKDYKVSYINNIEVGTAILTVTGINGYTGTMSTKFKIAPLNAGTVSNKITAETVSENICYKKGGVSPEIIVKRKDYVLTEGIDYKVSYSNNKNITTDSKKAKYTVSFIGNYSGKIEGTFDIAKSVFADLSEVPMQDAYDILEGKPVKSTKITLYDTDDKPLSAGTDYEKEFEYYSGPEFRDDQKLDKDTIPSTSPVYVVVTGKGNYDNSRIALPIRVVKYDIAKANAKTNVQQYTGTAVEPDANELIDGDFTIKLGTETRKLVEGKDYYIVGYLDADKRGTAKAVIEGCGDFGGRKILNYKITAKKIKK